MLISTWLARLFGDVVHNWAFLSILIGGAWILCLLAAKGLVVTADEAADRWRAWRERRRTPEPPGRDDWPASYDHGRQLGEVTLARYVESEFDAIASYLEDLESCADDAEDGLAAP